MVESFDNSINETIANAVVEAIKSFNNSGRKTLLFGGQRGYNLDESGRKSLVKLITDTNYKYLSSDDYFNAFHKDEKFSMHKRIMNKEFNKRHGDIVVLNKHNAELICLISIKISNELGSVAPISKTSLNLFGNITCTGEAPLEMYICTNRDCSLVCTLNHDALKNYADSHSEIFDSKSVIFKDKTEDCISGAALLKL